MATYKKILILTGLLALLIYFNISVVQKEKTLKNGTLVLLELAPVDPRSLIQGDYMSLRYKIAEDRDISSNQRFETTDEHSEKLKTGYCILLLDEHHIGQKVRLEDHFPELQSGEIAIKYKNRNYAFFQLGAESYFFEEGQATLFEKAKFGGLMVDGKGNSILVGLYDENLQLITPK